MQLERTAPLSDLKFQDPDITAKGDPRAYVDFDGFKTLWFNTGTLCNITCVNCYIESSPTNDRLVYLTCADMSGYLDELVALQSGPIEIGFTGGEPFLNPEIIEMMRLALSGGHSVLMLTNAMRPMMRPRVQAALITGRLACTILNAGKVGLRRLALVLIGWPRKVPSWPLPVARCGAKMPRLNRPAIAI
jgi:4Fe-4S single cluster domain